MSLSTASSPTMDSQVLVTRTLNAPREQVFAMWSQADHLQRWFAPEGCTIEFYNFDFRVGGTFRSRLVNPKFRTCLCEAEFLEIEAPERLSYKMYFVDDNGDFLTARQVNMDPEWPDETVITVTFKDLGGQTELTLHQTVAESIAQRTGALPSWLQMLNRLGDALDG